MALEADAAELQRIIRDGLKENDEYNQPTTSTPVERELNAAAMLYKQRNTVYKDSYKRIGHVLVGMFPDGLTLTTAEDFNRFVTLIQIAGKINRYANNFHKPHGHVDSLRDNLVYTAMLLELDDAENATPF